MDHVPTRKDEVTGKDLNAEDHRHRPVAPWAHITLRSLVAHDIGLVPSGISADHTQLNIGTGDHATVSTRTVDMPGLAVLAVLLNDRTGGHAVLSSVRDAALECKLIATLHLSLPGIIRSFADSTGPVPTCGLPMTVRSSVVTKKVGPVNIIEMVVPNKPTSSANGMNSVECTCHLALHSVEINALVWQCVLHMKVDPAASFVAPNLAMNSEATMAHANSESVMDDLL